MNAVSATSDSAPIEAVMIDSTLMRTGPSCTASSNSSGTGMPRDRTETAWRNAPWTSCATANDVNSSETKLALRSGRNAMSSISTDARPAAITPDQRDHDERRTEVRGGEHGVPGDRDELAVGEVQHAEHPVDHREPEREQGVDAAERQGVDQLLHELRRAHFIAS